MIKKTLIISFVVLITELILRWIWGFGTPILMEHSKTFEYRLKPNQNVTRLGNSIVTNGFGMRSPEPGGSGTIKILKLGDSIINGGSWVSNKDLSSSILERELKEKVSDSIQVLNISAGSWGPDNVFAYLEEFGTFNAQFAVFVFSSHDYNDIMTHAVKVGNSVDFPDKNPPFAIYEAITRYVWPKLKSFFGLRENERFFPGYENPEVGFNPGFENLLQILNENNIKHLAYLHPTLEELNNQDYQKHGKLLISFYNQKDVATIKGLDFLTSDCYRDGIHLNTKGQKVMAEAIFPHIVEMINSNLPKVVQNDSLPLHP